MKEKKAKTPDLSKVRIKNYDKVELKKTKTLKIKPVDEEKALKVGVLTSGGDAPGMNAAVRAIVRSGRLSGLDIYGIRHGYQGLINGEIERLLGHDVSEKIQKGGTFLYTARCKEFMTDAGVMKAYDMARIHGLDAIITIGGDGTFRGAGQLAKAGMPVIGIPATIDNDVASSDYTIGFDTAMNTAVEAIDKLRDTAFSHERCSVIEVMGRDAGYIAYNVGIACGAESILIPELKYDLEKDVFKVVIEGKNYGKKHWIVIVAEGAGDSAKIAEEIEKNTGVEARLTVLGYIQRGGAPTVKDRTTASLMGIHAVDCILSGKYNRLVVEKDGAITDVDITKGLKQKKSITKEQLFAVARLL